MAYKYFGAYHGPSYGSLDSEYLMAFRSMADAKEAFRSFQSGWVAYDELYLNPDGLYVPWRTGAYVSTPGTTERDYMDLRIGELRDRGQYAVSDLVHYRLTLGPRGGVVIE